MAKSKKATKKKAAKKITKKAANAKKNAAKEAIAKLSKSKQVDFLTTDVARDPAKDANEASPVPMPIILDPNLLRKPIDRIRHLRVTQGSSQMLDVSLAANTRVITDTSVIPYKAIGRIDITYKEISATGSELSNGEVIRAQGSGFVIGRRVVLTAAHVIQPITHQNGRNFKLTNVEFTPHFGLGGQPYFGARVIVHPDFYQRDSSGNFFTANALVAGPDNEVTTVVQFATLNRFDLGVMLLDPDDNPFDAGLGYSADFLDDTPSPTSPCENIGYPARPRSGFSFNGNRMWASTGNITKASVNDISKFSHLTPGCSGGPMVINSADGQFVVGLNSHLRGTEEEGINPDIMYSPNFGDDLMTLLKKVAEHEDTTGVDFF